MTLTWTPRRDGGSAITDYGVQYRTAGADLGDLPRWDLDRHYGNGDLLTNGTSYEFRVQARNAVGWGPWSHGLTATPGRGRRAGGPDRA